MRNSKKPHATCKLHGSTFTEWRDALETVINSCKLSDALGNPSTQRKCYYSPIWQITQYITDKNNTTVTEPVVTLGN